MIKILILILALSSSLLAKDLPRFYINGFKSDKNSQDIARKMQSFITTDLTSSGKERFLFLDDDAVVGLLDQETRRLVLGGKVESNLSKIGKATKSQEMILSQITKTNTRYEISLKHISTQPYSIRSNIILSFYSYQVKYYSSEIAKKILDPSYAINQNNISKP